MAGVAAGDVIAQVPSLMRLYERHLIIGQILAQEDFLVLLPVSAATYFELSEIFAKLSAIRSAFRCAQVACDISRVHEP